MWQVLLAVAVAGSTSFIANHFLHHLNHKEEEQSSIEMDQPEAEERSEANMVEVQYEVFRDGVDELEGIITNQKNGALPLELYEELCHSLVEQQGNQIDKLQSKLKEKEAQLQGLKDCIRRLNEEKNYKVDKRSKTVLVKRGTRFSKGWSGLLLIPCASFSLGGWFRGVFLFGCGLGVGIMYMMSAWKAEISKLSGAMDDTSKVVQELKTELSTMMSGAEQGGKRFALPGIEEEKCRSSESIATDKSTASGIPEDDLFGDSIQKSSKEIQKAEEKLALTGEDMRRSNDSVSTLTTDNSTLGGALEDDDLSGASERVSSVSQNKLMTKASLEKPSVVLKGKTVSPSPDASKRGSRTGESASSSLRASSLSAIPTKRASLSAGCIKVEKDNGKTVTGISASRCGVLKPLPSVKSSSGAVKTPTRTNRNQPTSSRISPRVKSLTKRSSSISPASFRCWKPF